MCFKPTIACPNPREESITKSEMIDPVVATMPKSEGPATLAVIIIDEINVMYFSKRDKEFHLLEETSSCSTFIL